MGDVEALKKFLVSLDKAGYIIEPDDEFNGLFDGEPRAAGTK